MKRTLTGTYAAAYLSRQDREAIHEFLSYGWGIDPSSIVTNLHLTLYTAPMHLPSVRETREDIEIECDVSETRFMLMAPGGENPRPELAPSQNKVGIRFTRRNVGIEAIHSLRQRVCYYETSEIIGSRQPSGRQNNAFGARQYQPHMTLLRRGAIFEADLSEIGAAFRNAFQYIRFDTFIIKVS